MKSLLLLCVTVVAFPGLAIAQCNPSLPGTCAPNDPVLFGIQQEQQSRDMQQREIQNQNQKLQQIERQNTQRYQSQGQSQISVPATGSGYMAVPSIIAPARTQRHSRSKAVRRHAPAHHAAPRKSR